MGAVLTILVTLRPNRASQLLDKLEEFMSNPLSMATLVAPANGNPAGREVYLVPQRYTFSSTSDSAALVRLDHVAETMEVIDIIADYGDTNAEWRQVLQKAQAHLP